MFESAELTHKIDKAVYHREEPKLREALLNAQYDLHEERTLSGADPDRRRRGCGQGRDGEPAQRVDGSAPHPHAYAFPDPSDEERERPAMWRFWRALPPKGKIGIFFGAWHTVPIVERVQGELSEGEFSQQIGEILRFEKMLCDEGVLLLKFWFHLSKRAAEASA